MTLAFFWWRILWLAFFVMVFLMMLGWAALLCLPSPWCKGRVGWLLLAIGVVIAAFAAHWVVYHHTDGGLI